MSEQTFYGPDADPTDDSIFGESNSLVREFLSLPGYLGDRHMSPLFANGIPLGRLQKALESANLAGQRQQQEHRFWSTPSRPQAQDPIRDIIEIDLSGPKPVNHVTFDLAHFPHVAELEFAVNPDGPWFPVRYPDGGKVALVVSDSVPQVLSQTVRQSNRHPQHYGAGHWVNHDIKVQCLDGLGVVTEASALRLVLSRPFLGNEPTNSLGEPQPYSLGVRSFTCGYKVESREDVPDRPLRRGSITQHEAFAETRDILGSTLSYGLRETPAGNLTLGGIWRSGPQPVNYSVVSLYVSLSQQGDDAAPAESTTTTLSDYLSDALVLTGVESLTGVEQQTIDRIYMDPLVSGCTVNIYYTNDTPLVGAADPWANVAWTPINRDFKLRRGFYHFDPVRARHLKLEFTHLAPESYEAALTQVRTVQVFPHNIFINYVSSRSRNTGGVGTQVTQALDPEFRFADNFRPVAAGITDLSKGYTPTEVFWSDDPGAAWRLRQLSGTYNYTAWQGQLVAPRFVETGTHSYIDVEVEHSQRLAFYVGLKALEVYRVNYSANEDTDQYLDYFLDGHNISDSQGWILDPQDLRTPTERPADAEPWRITSKVFTSKSNVIGVQYATTQTPAIDLLAGADSDFNSASGKTQSAANTALSGSWEPVGDAATFTRADGTVVVNPSASTRYNTDIGTTVKIERQGTTETPPRNSKPHVWDAIGLRYGTYGNMQRLLWRDLDAGTSLYESSLVGGIRNRTSVTPAIGSRVYAAARVISPIPLENPLTLRLVNIDGDVVAEGIATIPANQIVEWFVDYTVGFGGDPVANEWLYLESRQQTYDEWEQFTYAQMEKRVEPRSETLFLELVQKGVPNASFYVDTLSLFEDPILWEFSNNGGRTWWPAYGIRNNANGVLTFPSDPHVKECNTYDDLMGIFRNEDTVPDHPVYAVLSNNGTTTYSELEGRSYKDAPLNNKLMWRATCSRTDIHVNGLSIRPWYDAYEGGLPAAEGVNVSGPNIAMYDHYQPIHFDPRYRMWNKPVPQSWYFFYRQFLLSRHEDIQVTA